MCNDGQLESRESSDMRAIREALGAVAAGKPAVYWLYGGSGGYWHVRREGDLRERCFPKRELALAHIQVEVARCASYCLFLQRGDGRFVKEFFNWLPDRPQDPP